MFYQSNKHLSCNENKRTWKGSAFSGVSKMLIRKSFSMDIRALHLAV